MPLYRVTLEADFTTKATARDVVANRLRKMLREANFDVKDFEWSVEAIKPKSVFAAPVS